MLFSLPNTPNERKPKIFLRIFLLYNTVFGRVRQLFNYFRHNISNINLIILIAYYSTIINWFRLLINRYYYVIIIFIILYFLGMTGIVDIFYASIIPVSTGKRRYPANNSSKYSVIYYNLSKLNYKKRKWITSY